MFEHDYKLHHLIQIIQGYSYSVYFFTSLYRLGCIWGYDLRDQTNADRPFYLIEGEVSDQRSPRQVLWAHWAAAPSADPQYGGTRERNEKS